MSLKLEGSRSRSVLVLLTFLWGLSAAAEKLDFTAALLSYNYEDKASGGVIASKEIQGFYALHSRLESEEGKLVHVLSEDGANHGCSTLQNVPVKGGWIALIERGGCKFHDKIVRATESNASAVIVYDNEHNTNLLVMTHYGKYANQQIYVDWAIYISPLARHLYVAADVRLVLTFICVIFPLTKYIMYIIY